jgi:hypothetical protein
LGTYLKSTFPGRDFSEGEIALLAQFRNHLAPIQVEGFHRLHWQLNQAFLSRSTGAPAPASADFRRTVARQFARIGYNLLERDRSMGWRELGRALAISPSAVFQQPWARILALTLLGAQARRLRKGSH